MKKIAGFIVIALLICMMGACDRPESRRLQRAEAVMESAPDSALAILDSIDTASLTHASDRALYALLLTQGRIKTYEVLTDDSLISTAVRYYEDHGPDSNLMKSLFYQGEILSNNREFSKAILPSMRAREMAISADNPYWHAKASELIGDILSLTYQKDSALIYINEAVTNYLKSDKIANYRYCIVDLGTVYGNIGKYDLSIKLIDSIYHIALEEADSNLTAYSLNVLYAMSFLSGKNDDALRYFNELKEYRDYYEISLQDMAWNTQISLNDSTFRLFEEYINKYPLSNNSATSNANALYTRLLYHKKKNNLDSAIICYDSLFNVFSGETNNVLKQSVVNSQKKYIETIAKDNEHELQNLRRLIIVVAIIFIIVSIAVLIFIRQQNRLKRSELENKMKDIMILSGRIKDQDKRMNRLSISQNRILHLCENLYKERWDTINNLCNEYFDKEDSDFSRRKIIAAVEKEINKLGEKKHILIIEKSINRHMNGIMDKIRTQCPWLKEDETILIELIIAGFNTKAICLIMKIKLNSFYSKRRRIIEKIVSSNISDRNIILSKIR